jgi:hypothetical protein
MAEETRYYSLRLKVGMDTPYRNLAVDRVLGMLRGADIEADVEDESEYDTPEQEREKNPESWFYLSFASGRAFLGGAIVRANGPASAIQRAVGIGIHFADAGVECTPVTDEELAEHIPAELRDRLLTEEEVRELGGE